MIEEHISGEIQYYDAENECWTTYLNGVLSDANVISCSTKNQCCENNKFTVGGAFAGSLQLVCRLPGFSRYHLFNARIIIRSWFGNDASKAKMRGVFWAMQVTRTKDIFTIQGMDALGWTDVPAPKNNSGYFITRVASANGHDPASGKVFALWFENFFTALNSVLQSKTGIPNLLQFRAYNAAQNCGIQYGNHFACDGWWSETNTCHYFAVDWADDGFKTEKPRDVLHWIAEGIGGFITVEGDGRFTMRNFNMPELGIAEIRDADTEADSLEISDYYIYPKTVLMKYITTDSWGDVLSGSSERTDPYDEPEFSGFDFTIDMNALMDASTGHYWFGSLIWGEFYAFARYEDVDIVNGENVLVPSVEQSHIGLYKAYPVPFRCKVHKPVFFELGQTVVFPDHPNAFNNYRYGYSAHVPYIRSTITEIEWTFRGGTKLACGEGECRSMIALALDSKADSVRRELRTRTQTDASDARDNSIWNGTSEEFALLESYNPKAVYTIVDTVQTRSTAKRSRSTPNYTAKLYVGNVDVVGAAMNGLQLWDGTQEQYDSIPEKSDKTVYIIKEGAT